MRSISLLLIGFLIFSSAFSQNNPSLKCKDETNERIRKTCITKSIQEYVDTNFNIAEITSYAKPGVNKIYTRFKIDPIGRITDIQAKASSLKLELEAIRTLQSFPYIIPKAQTTISSGEKEIFEDIHTLLITFQVNTTVIDLSSQKRITGND